MQHQSAETAEYTKMQTKLNAKDYEVQCWAPEKERLQKEVDGRNSALRETPPKLTAKDEVEFERTKAQGLEAEKESLQKEVDGKHDAEMQNQSAETAQYTHMFSETQNKRDEENVVIDAAGQQASTTNDSSVGEVREYQLTQTKGLEAIEQERDFFRAKAKRLQKQVDEFRQSSKKDADEFKKEADELRQLSMAVKKIADRRNDESCPSGASTQAEEKPEV
jgi:hypothetical protein